MKRTELTRKTRIKPKRSKPRKRKTVIRLEGKAMKDLRKAVYYRANGYCELKLAPDCEIWAGENTRGEMAHYPVSRGAGANDDMDSCKWACRKCHNWEHNGGKPCPPKVQVVEAQ